jgi:GGDEF domain-containing protein
MCRPVEVPGGHYAEVGANIGIALAAGAGAGEQDLISRADLAMDEAKRNGRGCFAMYRPSQPSDGAETLERVAGRVG